MRKLRFQPLSKIASIAVGGVHLVWTGELEPFGTGLLMTGTAQKLNPTQGQDLPKESLRLASALVQPGGVGRGAGEVWTDLGKYLGPRARVGGKPRTPQLYWLGSQPRAGKGTSQGTWQSHLAARGQCPDWPRRRK